MISKLKSKTLITIILLCLFAITSALTACSKINSSVEEDFYSPTPTVTVTPTEAAKEVISDNDNDLTSEITTDDSISSDKDISTDQDVITEDSREVGVENVEPKADANPNSETKTSVNSDTEKHKNAKSEKNTSDKAKDTSTSDKKETDKKDEKDKIKDDKNNKEKKVKYMVAIDAGHQGKGNYEKEPIGPGAKTTKAKVSSGTQGVASGVPEYKLTLVISKKVKEELLNRGYDVYMIRETHDVNISNKERADMANKSGADIFIRIHADGSTNSDVTGTSTLYPSKDNPYVSKLSKKSYALSDYIVDSICEQTGSKNRGAIARDDMSGINWCSIPVSIIEMGYMSNKKEDKLMQTEEYQNNIVEGICNGIDQYFDKFE